MTESQKFRGFQGPNYTQVPDQLFDELLADLPGGELKVLLYVMRRTFGFKKDSDNISLSQMLTGIKTRDGRQLDRGVGLSKPTLLKALRELIKKDILIAVRRQSREHGDESTNYRLNIIGETGARSTASSSESREQSSGTPVVKEFAQGGSRPLPTPVAKEISQPVVKEVASQETVRQHTVFKNVNVANNTPSGSSGRNRSATAVSEQALMNRYGFDEQQIDKTRSLVALQIDVLGAGDRNHAGYVKRAAEAVRDDTANILQLTLGEVKDTSHRKAIVSLPAYFTRVYDATRAEALRAKPELVPTDEPLRSTPPTDDDLRRLQREQLIESITARGYRIPDQIRRSSIGDIAAWYDQVERTQPVHP